MRALFLVLLMIGQQKILQHGAEGFLYCHLFHFLDDGQNHRAALGAVEEVFSEGVSHLGLDGVPFGDVAGFAAV